MRLVSNVVIANLESSEFKFVIYDETVKIDKLQTRSEKSSKVQK